MQQKKHVKQMLSYLLSGCPIRICL